jgi:hypothetical protein
MFSAQEIESVNEGEKNDHAHGAYQQHVSDVMPRGALPCFVGGNDRLSWRGIWIVSADIHLNPQKQYPDTGLSC